MLGIVNQMCVFCLASSHSIACDLMSPYVCANLKYIYVALMAIYLENNHNCFKRGRLLWYTCQTMKLCLWSVVRDGPDHITQSWSKSSLTAGERCEELFRHCTAVSGWMTFKASSQSCNAIGCTVSILFCSKNCPWILFLDMSFHVDRKWKCSFFWKP